MFQSVQEKGAYLRSRIEALDLPCLGATRGMGLMIGIDVKGERTNKELAAKLIQSGLLVLTAGPGLRCSPPGHHPGGDGQGPGHPESSAFLTSARRAGPLPLSSSL